MDEQLNKLLARHGSWRKVAIALGITEQHLSRIKNGKAGMSSGLRARIMSSDPLQYFLSKSTRREVIESILDQTYLEGRRSVITLEELDRNREATPQY